MTPHVDERAPPTPRRSILQLIIRLMSGALISKLLGFVREIAMAMVIGTAVVADAFRTSITLILLPISFLQSETVPAILIPMQQEEIRRGHGATSLAALTIALTAISLVLMLALQTTGLVLVDLVVAGFSAEEKALTFEFVRIMALAMPASVMLNVLSAGEIALGLARISNARAAFQNLSVLIGLACVALGGNVILLGWAFSISFNGVALWACIILAREGNLSLHGITLHKVLSVAREFFARLKPFIPLPFVEQSHIWVERFFTSRLQVGAIASLDYARTLTESFQLLISQPVGLAMLAHIDRDKQEAQAEIITRIVLAFTLPACAFLYVFSDEIVTIVFKRGAFGESGLVMTSQALSGISVGLWASTLGWILLRQLNGTNRNLRAAAILIAAYAANILFNTFISSTVEADQANTTFIGLGESVRALTLLAGVLFSMPNSYRLTQIIGLAILPALLMLSLGLGIEYEVGTLLPRLFLGALALAVAVTVAITILAPSLFKMALSRWRTR